MRNNRRKWNRWLEIVLKISFPLSILLYLVRGFGLVSFLPGWIFLITIVLFVFSFLGYLTIKTYN